jgi:ABC-2 type transport system permease protein
MLGRILWMLFKEFAELRRDKAARFLLLVPPLLQMLAFGYAATFDVSHVPTAVLDLDHTQESRDLLSRFTANRRFTVTLVAQSEHDIGRAIDRGDALIGLIIHPGFANLLRKGQTAPLQVIVDGTNSNSALIALGYVNDIAATFSADYAAELLQRVGVHPAAQPLQIDFEPRPWFNAGLDSRWFFVPGVIATITLIMIVNLTSFAVVREREAGTLEQIMVTPIRPVEFILGKTVPFFIIGIGLVALIAGFGILWFRVPFTGSPLVMLLGTSLYLLSALALGLLISTVCTTQQQAFATNFFLMVPLFILSGFSFPIASMPTALQWFTYVDPMRYYLVVIRAVFLKGLGLAVLWPEMAALAALAALLLAASVAFFRKSLD